MKSIFVSIGLLLSHALLLAQAPATAPVPPLPPVDFKIKANWWLRESFGIEPLLTSAVVGGYRMLNPPNAYPREWRQGAAGYGRNVGNNLASNVAGSTAQFGVASLIGEDPRYHPSGASSIKRRIGHALLFTFVDKSDRGRRMPALSNFAGAIAAGFITKTYMPQGFNDSVHAGQWTLINFGTFAGSNLQEEFKPELRRLGKKLHLPLGR
ncbi:hypothetical protein [Bryobacter aggregatus]|uniref:hypothetical protein n=1 Tax=Bryobacter aggregatus TaxID=360054 RepID=UPI0004E143ED|nr:hypothetical protein [Bryobacter aggregatus]